MVASLQDDFYCKRDRYFQGEVFRISQAVKYRPQKKGTFPALGVFRRRSKRRDRLSDYRESSTELDKLSTCLLSMARVNRQSYKHKRRVDCLVLIRKPYAGSKNINCSSSVVNYRDVLDYNLPARNFTQYQQDIVRRRVPSGNHMTRSDQSAIPRMRRARLTQHNEGKVQI